MLTFARSWGTNFYIPESLTGLTGRVTTGAIVIARLYAAQFLSPRRLDDEPPSAGNWLSRTLTHFDLHARLLFAILATLLLSVLLFYEVSGRLLTVAWRLEGVALAMAGFAMRERSLRLSGLILLGVCILKVFLYDLRELGNCLPDPVLCRPWAGASRGLSRVHAISRAVATVSLKRKRDVETIRVGPRTRPLAGRRGGCRVWRH